MKGALTAALVILAATSTPTQAQGRWGSEDVHQALARVGPRTRCVVGYELGGTPYNPSRAYNPYATNPSSGARGPIQMMPGGVIEKLFLATTVEDALAQGWDEEAAWAPNDIYRPDQTILFLQHMILSGYGSHWSPILLGLC